MSYSAAMDELKRPSGATTETVRANLVRLRTGRRLGHTALSAKLEELGRPISTLGLRRLEQGARRIDVDDLFALAVALGVSPVTLLLPNAADGDERVEATGVDGKLDAERLWAWLFMHEPLDPEESTLEYRLTARPAWKRRELEANTRYVEAKLSGDSELSVKRAE